MITLTITPLLHCFTAARLLLLQTKLQSWPLCVQASSTHPETHAHYWTAPVIGEQCRHALSHCLRRNSQFLPAPVSRTSKWAGRAVKKRRNVPFGINSAKPWYTGFFNLEGFTQSVLGS